MKKLIALLMFLLITPLWSKTSILKCKNPENFFTITIYNRTEGIVQYKKIKCPIQVQELNHNRNGVSENNLELNFEINNCREDIFYKKGFLQIKKAASVILALNGQQVIDCSTTPNEIRNLVKIAD